MHSQQNIKEKNPVFVLQYCELLH